MEWTSTPCIYTLHSIYAIIEWSGVVCSVHRNPEPEHGVSAAECPQIQSWCLNFDVPLLRGETHTWAYARRNHQHTNIPTLNSTFNIQWTPWTPWTHVVTPVITIRALHGYCRFDHTTPIIPGRNRSEFHVKRKRLLSNFQGKESCFAWYNYYCATAWVVLLHEPVEEPKPDITNYKWPFRDIWLLGNQTFNMTRSIWHVQ